MKQITSFSGEYRFLSNFVGGVEAKYQAAKTLDPKEKWSILNARTPGRAKRLGKKVKLRPDWEQIKFKIMEDLVRDKFKKEPFRTQLLKTGDSELIEGNTWSDYVWGCVKHGNEWKGENHLGKILMKIRSELQR